MKLGTLKNNQVKVLATATGFAVAALLTFSGSAQAAGSATSNLSVTATVTANCSISTTPVAFGAYDPLSASNGTANGTVAIACTKGSAPSVTLGLGSNASGSTRRMKGGTLGDFLAYELYQPTTTTPGDPCPAFGAGTVWGTSGTNIFTPTSATSKASRTYNVCGQLASGQDVSADSYSDTVVATVNY